MTPVSTPVPMRLRTPTDVLAATPYLMGFHPDDSLVGLGLKGTRLAFHLRGDLPPDDAPPDLVDATARQFAAMFQQQGMTAVVLVGYGSAERVDPIMAALTRQLETQRIKVREAIRADDGRWWSYQCTNPECCPAEGTPYEVASTEIAAMATVAGCVALPNRESVVRSLDPPTGHALDAFREALQRATDRMGEVVDAGGVAEAGVRAVDEACARYREGGRLGDDELAWLCVLVQFEAIRDLAWHRIDTAPDSLKPHEWLWSDALRRCDPALAAPIGVLLAYTFWQAGEGLRASIALDRALAADPGCALAQLMVEALRLGLPPKEPARARRRRRKARPRARRRRRR